MPLAFPSHQGLIAPLWRRWPQYFDVPAMIVGAAMPDVVDGCSGLFRGHLGQSLGHTVVGLFLFCIPGGIVLWFVLHAIMDRMPYASGTGWCSATWNRAVRPFADAPPLDVLRNHTGLLLWSLGVGAFSHLLIDLVSHRGFKVLLPWYKSNSFFPDWWYTEWMRIQLPGYTKPYPFGPHLIVWLALSLLGIVILLRRPSSPLQKARDGENEDCRCKSRREAAGNASIFKDS